MPGTNHDERSNIGAKVATANKTALQDIAWERDEKSDRVHLSDLIRDSIELYLAVQKASGDVPEDAKDDVEHIDADEVLEEHGVAVARADGVGSREVEL